MPRHSCRHVREDGATGVRSAPYLHGIQRHTRLITQVQCLLQTFHGDGRFGIESAGERDEVAGWWRAFDADTASTSTRRDDEAGSCLGSGQAQGEAIVSELDGPLHVVGFYLSRYGVRFPTDGTGGAIGEQVLARGRAVGREIPRIVKVPVVGRRDR